MKNEVKEFDSYLDLLKYSEQSFAEEIFIETSIEKFRFRDFTRLVCSAASGLSNCQEKYIVLCVESPVKFAVLYFAVTLTDHVACLIPSGHKIPDKLSTSLQIDDGKADELMEHEPFTWENFSILDSKAPCTIAFSSGTTQQEKGIVLSQYNLLQDTEYGMKRYRYWVGERLLHILPYWHLFGLVTDLLAPLHAGSRIYMSDSALFFFRDLKNYRPHSINLPPALADAICLAIENGNSCEQVTGGCLQKILCAGAPLSISTAKKLQNYGILPCTAYGLTECSPCISITSEDDIRLGTSGIPLDCVKVKIAEDGEIQVCGTTVMLGYFEEVEESRMKDGFFCTGDIGEIDDYGHLTILGRKSNMLVFSNGKKCMPEVVEQMIQKEVPGVEECLLGYRDVKTTDIAKLTITSQNKTVQLVDQVYEVMRSFGLYPCECVIQPEKLPRNAMGKVVRE